MPTIKDIAEKAKVAKSTASYSLNDRYGKHINISEKTRSHVKKIAEEMGYRPDDMARAISTGKARVIGFATAAPERETSAAILNGMTQEAASYDYLVKLINVPVPYGSSEIEKIVDICRTQRLSALICNTLLGNYPEILHKKLLHNNIQLLVAANAQCPGDCIQAVSNNIQGAFLAVEHLAGQGHRKIAHFSYRSDFAATVERKTGFFAALKKFKIEIPDNYYFGSDYYSEISDYTKKLFSDPATRPSAVFCAGDDIANTVTCTLLSMNLKIPENVSIIGFGNLSFSNSTVPALTTIDESNFEVGRVLAQAAIKGCAEKRLIVPVKLIKRDSCTDYA